VATYEAGDIHGNLAALRDLLAKLAIEARHDDTVVFLGDYIARGLDGRGCIEAILAVERSITRRWCACSGTTRTRPSGRSARPRVAGAQVLTQQGSVTGRRESKVAPNCCIFRVAGLWTWLPPIR
jgi:hypothetical protein